MKSYFLTLAALIFAFGTAPLEAQYQPPAPYNTQNPPAPYNNGYNSGQAAPYNTQNPPSPYNNGYSNGQGAPDPYAPQGGQSTGAQAGDEQQSGEARVSFLQGDVSSQIGGNGDWVALSMNAPVSPGDHVATGSNSRTELQLDAADILRLSNNTTANLVSLNRDGIQVQIGQGLASFTVVRESEANPEIDTPNGAIHPNGAAEFRIQVNSDTETVVTVRSGSADISTPQGSTHVDRGQVITIEGTDDPQYRVDAANGTDSWDSWNDDRNRRILSAQSWHKTDPYYTGSEDLDNYGVWSEVPDYGQVWTPSDPDPNWAPYRAGRWVWTPSYGWTWVSNEPWGWAPYHYGRWFVYGGRWSWWPGPVATYPGYYPVWAPAYVSFFGWGGGGFGVGFGFGFGSVGWFPIGPCDWFHPWWGGWGRGYRTYGFGEINRFHEGFGPLAGERFGGRRFSNVDGVMRDSHLQRGISSMSSREFGHGAVPGNQQRFNESSLRQASAVSGRMPISPSRGSFSPSGRNANPGALRGVSSGSQHFFSSNSRGSTGFNGNRGFAGGNHTGGINNGGGRPGSFERPSSGNNAAINRGNTFNRSQSFGGSSTGPQSEARGWQHFSPSSRGSQSQGFNSRSFSQGQNHGSFEPPSASRGGASHSYPRPPLNMRQPIVTPRSGSSYGNGGGFNSSRGGGFYTPRSNSSYGNAGVGSRGSTFNNSSRGGAEIPRGNSGYGGFNNNSSRGGGGGFQAPRGNYSAPQRGNSGGGSGGGSRGGGGGGSHGGGGGHSSGGGGHHH